MHTPHDTPSRLDVWARRLGWAEVIYARAHGRMLHLFPPVLFSEKIIWRKLFDSHHLYTQLSDKLAVRDYIAAHGLGHLLVPLLWTGTNPSELAAAGLTPPFVIKSNHASGHAIFINPDTSVDWAEIGRKTTAWLAFDHGTETTEPGYLNIPPKLMVEPYLSGPDGVPPDEYKIFVFDGIARVVMHVVVDPGREGDERERYNMFYDMSWRRLPWKSDAGFIDKTTSPPERLAEMVTAAERLAAGFDHLRVDFYASGANAFIGEISIYSWSGLGGVSLDGDTAMGQFWTLDRPIGRAMRAIRYANWGRMEPAR